MEGVEITIKAAGTDALTFRFTATDAVETTRERLAVIAWTVALATGRTASKVAGKKAAAKPLTDLVQEVAEVTS